MQLEESKRVAAYDNFALCLKDFVIEDIDGDQELPLPLKQKMIEQINLNCIEYL
jgi:hypothetical protein